MTRELTYGICDKKIKKGMIFGSSLKVQPQWGGGEEGRHLKGFVGEVHMPMRPFKP